MKQRYGKAFIPPDMPAQDWPISYKELEPYYDRFERTAGVSGKAGNLQGARQDGGNVFEAARAREYPLPPLESSYAQVIFAETSAQSGYHPFPRPSANASRAYTNPDGARLGACVYCGHCERFGCEANAKGSPHITVIPQAMARSNFELRTHAWVTKVLLDSTKRKATGVLYTNVSTGEEYEQPAAIVALCAYAINNVHLHAAVEHRHAVRSGLAEGDRGAELLLPASWRRRHALLRRQDLQPVHGDRLLRDGAR